MEKFPLVSIIIPCYNAERWVAEAIQSCLDQTYSPIEIIVIDDGSTDKCLEIIRSFGNIIHWETGPNRGGNHARNRGLTLSKGEFVQFLDADDYILPEKIARQIKCFEETGADVVYGDWRHQRHYGDEKGELENVVISGRHTDMLEALLSSWWVASLAVLFNRNAVIKIGGWDESLFAAQDTDLMIRLALANLRFRYQPGCHSIYRRYGNVTVGTSNPKRALDNLRRVLDKALAVLGCAGLPKYKQALASSYFQIARGYFEFDRLKYHDTIKQILDIEPEFKPNVTRLYNITWKIFGFKGAEWLAYVKRQLLPTKWFII